MTPGTSWELALAQARQALRLSNPNPRVGCVVVSPSGQLLARGHTQAVGGPHAEAMALKDAQTGNIDVRGSTAYVTLEPCSHFGKTPPCCDALVAAGVTRVHVAVRDPNPLVSGQGLARLRAAGVDVHVLPADHPVAIEATELNIGFMSRMIRKRPWVRMKVAASLDGATALANGQSQWITGPEARADGHAWRARACAVLTGIGTVLEDNPRLDVREVDTPRQPKLVLVDSRVQTPPDAQLFQPRRQVWLCAAQPQPEREAPLIAQGVEVLHLPQRPPADAGKTDLAALLDELARREINEVHVEAGHALNGSLLRAGLVDECLIYLAPRLLGPGMGLARLGPFESLDQALQMEFTAVDRVGADLRILARPPHRTRFLQTSGA